MSHLPNSRRRWYLPELKDVVWAVVLLNIGFGGACLLSSGVISFGAGVSRQVQFAITFVLTLCCFAAIGAGCGALLKRKLLGAAIAVVAVGSIMVAVLFV